MNFILHAVLGVVIFFTSVTTDSSVRTSGFQFDTTPHGDYDYFASLECMALNIYNEARGESLTGKSAVAWVVMNRVRDSRYLDTPCDVVYAGHRVQNSQGDWKYVRDRCSFSWVCDGNMRNAVAVINNPIDQKNWDDGLIAAKYALDGVSIDPTHGATHYYNHNLVQPNWGYPITRVVANHTFLRKP